MGKGSHAPFQEQYRLIFTAVAGMLERELLRRHGNTPQGNTAGHVTERRKWSRKRKWACEPLPVCKFSGDSWRAVC